LPCFLASGPGEKQANQPVSAALVVHFNSGGSSGTGKIAFAEETSKNKKTSPKAKLLLL